MYSTSLIISGVFALEQKPDLLNEVINKVPKTYVVGKLL